MAVARLEVVGAAMVEIIFPMCTGDSVKIRILNVCKNGGEYWAGIISQVWVTPTVTDAETVSCKF